MFLKDSTYRSEGNKITATISVMSEYSLETRFVYFTGSFGRFSMDVSGLRNGVFTNFVPSKMNLSALNYQLRIYLKSTAVS